jgi:putative ABC transport system substrate-binding protein
MTVRRRDVVFLLGGGAAALASPRVTRAQPRGMPIVGLLEPRSPDAIADRLRGFRRGLKEAGFVEGENVAIEYRWADGQSARLPGLAAELVRQQASVIAATNTASALAARAATSTVPVVFAVPEDPVRLGLVAGIARPGGNATGINFFSQEVVTKRLELLRELVPAAARVAVLVNPTNAVTTETTVREISRAARSLELRVDVHNASSSREINAAFDSFARERPDALFVGGDAFFQVRRSQLVNLASRHAIPATYGGREFALAGGLMTYGTDFVEAYRQVGDYAGRILKGTKPADLPVMQASKFDLVINAETARMLSLDISPMLLARADEVIE